MNSERRKKLEQTLDSLDTLVPALVELRDEEQAALDNLPEGLQISEKGERMQECIDAFDELIEALENTPGVLREFT